MRNLVKLRKKNATPPPNIDRPQVPPATQARGNLVLIKISLLFCVNEVVLLLTRFIYITNAERSASKQGHLQPRCHAEARTLSRQL